MTDSGAVLVTGAASGIGEATARRFGAAGWRVYATDLRGGDVTVGDERLALDVTDGERVQEVVDRVVDETGGVDCVVNSAGSPRAGAVESVPVEEAREQFDVNIHGPHRIANAVLPHMRDRGGGTVVNVSSVLGRVTLPGTGTYCASKHALESLSDALRMEVDGFGVDVVLVEPGGVRTGFEEGALESSEPEEDGDGDGVYEGLHGRMERYSDILMRGRAAVEPERVAGVILDAAEADDPRDRYVVGNTARLMTLTNVLPTRVRDRVADLLF